MVLWGSLMRNGFLPSLFLCLGLIASPASALADRYSPPSYTRTFGGKLNFARPIEIPYILDSADADGDGHDDLALGAKIVPPRGGNVLAAPKVYSVLVQNLPRTGQFRPYNLGNNGLTHRTWAGAFVPGARGGPAHFVLGRNGEIGLPNEVVGERSSIFRIEPGSEGWRLSTVHVSDHLNTTGSVSVCDIDRDGTREVYVNNVASALSNGVPPHNRARMYQIGGGVRSVDPRRYMGGMQTGDVAIHNSVVFADIDGDGDCDLLAGYEALVPIRKGGPLVGGMGLPFAASDVAKFQSYVSLNEGGRFRSGPILLPNPPFGRNTSSFGIGGTRTRDGATVVALTSSYLPSHEEGFSRFALQLFELRGRQFVDVTASRLSGSVRMREANQSFVRFADIDGDGDEDFYLTLYDGGITVFMQSGGRFVAKTVRASGPSGRRAVAFLKAAGKPCMDLAVLDAGGNLYRFSCS